MRINWGTGIALFYCCFVISLLLQLKASFRYDHSLVVEDYYQHDLDYQKHYDKLVNTQQLEHQLDLKLDATTSELILSFPAGMDDVSGSIAFFRTNDSSLDFRLPVDLETQNRQRISVEDLREGLWKIKIDWRGNGLDYYDEKVVVL